MKDPRNVVSISGLALVLLLSAGCKKSAILHTDAAVVNDDAAVASDAGVAVDMSAPVDMFIAVDLGLAEDMAVAADMTVATDMGMGVDIGIAEDMGISPTDASLADGQLAVPTCGSSTGGDLRAYRIYEERSADAIPTVAGFTPGISRTDYFPPNLLVTTDNAVILGASPQTSGTRSAGDPGEQMLIASLLWSFQGNDARLLEDPDSSYFWDNAGTSQHFLGQTYAFAGSPHGATLRLLGELTNDAGDPSSLWTGTPRRLWYSPDKNTVPSQLDVSAVVAIAVGFPAGTLTDDAQNVPLTFVFDGDGYVHFIGSAVSDATSIVDVIASIDSSAGGRLPWTAHVVQTVAVPVAGPLPEQLTGYAKGTTPDGTARVLIENHYLQYSTVHHAWTLEDIPAIGPFDPGVSHQIDTVNLVTPEPSVVYVTGGGAHLIERQPSGDWTVSVLPADTSGFYPWPVYLPADGATPAIVLLENTVYAFSSAAWVNVGQIPLITSDRFPASVPAITKVDSNIARGPDGTIYVAADISYTARGTSQQVDDQLVLYVCPPGGDCWCR